ncbi:MAG: hypothetical protein V4464_07450, partial [Pseudomonadota bacterium]
AGSAAIAGAARHASAAPAKSQVFNIIHLQSRFLSARRMRARDAALIAVVWRGVKGGEGSTPGWIAWETTRKYRPSREIKARKVFDPF